MNFYIYAIELYGWTPSPWVTITLFASRTTAITQAFHPSNSFAILSLVELSFTFHLWIHPISNLAVRCTYKHPQRNFCHRYHRYICNSNGESTASSKYIIIIDSPDLPLACGKIQSHCQNGTNDSAGFHSLEAWPCARQCLMVRSVCLFVTSGDIRSPFFTRGSSNKKGNFSKRR